MSKIIALVNGPNLNLLGSREPEIYGRATLEQIVQKVSERAQGAGYAVRAYQSNSEGEIVDAIQQAGREAAGIIINAAAYTHTSVAVRDALEAVSVPSIEVHLSNIFRREEFRHHSFISGVVYGVICGFGPQSYLLALDALLSILPAGE